MGSEAGSPEARPARALLAAALLLALPAARGAGEDAAPALHWPVPVLRIGGVLAYDTRRESGFERDAGQDGVTATLNVATNTWLWEPWFARLDANLGVTMARNDSDGHEAAIFKQTRSTFGITTGSARLSVLPGTRFPFELHADRSDSRAATELALGNEHVGSRIGFVQQYLRPEGNTMIGWDRNTQDGSAGRARQDSTKFTLSQTHAGHRLQLMGDGARNTRSRGDELAAQDNLTVQYGFTPDESALSLDTLANVSRNDFRLAGASSRTDLSQLSSMAMWHSEESALSVVGGLRLFALDLAAGSSDPGAQVRNANLNAGANYDLTRALRLSANANLNHAQTNGRRETGSSQSAGASYQPEPLMLGAARYGWSAGVNGANRRGGQDAGQQLSVQLSHNMGRSVRLGEAAGLHMEGSQMLTAVANRGANARIAGNARQLTHSGSLSWDMARDGGGSSSVRMSASDTRELGAGAGFFQMVNLQWSSNLGGSAYSSFTGNLTLQAVRQSEHLVGASDPLARLSPDPGQGWVTLSSGSLSYQQQRLFGVPRLQFGSDLRLNSAALLPILGKASDQQTAAWENRLDYAIGRTRIRIAFVVARSPVQPGAAALLAGGGKAGPEQKMARAAMFNLSRGFGQF